MIKVNGSFEKLKAEMSLHKTATQQEISAIKKEAKKNKHKPDTEYASRKLNMYMQSKVLPVRVGEIAINYKLLNSFLNKTKKFPAEIAVNENSLQLDYRTGKDTTGQLKLYDISQYYTDFKHVPEAEVKQNE